MLPRTEGQDNDSPSRPYFPSGTVIPGTVNPVTIPPSSQPRKRYSPGRLSPSPVSKKEVLQEMMQAQAKNIKNYLEGKQTIQGQIRSINPSTEYIYGGSHYWGRDLVPVLQKNYMDFSRDNRPSAIMPVLRQVGSVPAGSLFYKQENHYIVATPEMQNLLGSYKQAGYVPPGGDVGFYSKPARPSDVLSQIKGPTTARIIIGSEGYMNLGLPFLFSGIEQGITGNDAFERQWQSYAYRGVMNLPGKGESKTAAVMRQLSSPEVIMDVYVPLATIGIGYIVKPVISPFLSTVGKRLAGAETASMIGGQYVKLNALQVAKGIAVSASVAVPSYQIISQPENISSNLGHLTSNIIMMGAGFRLGEMLYESRIPVSYPVETPMGLTQRFSSGYEIQGKIATKTYGLRSVDNPDELFFQSTVMNWPGRNVQSISVSSPFKQTDIEVSESDIGMMTKSIDSKYNTFTSFVYDEDTLNVVSGFSRGRSINDSLKYDFMPSRSQGMFFSNDEIGFFRGTSLTKSSYEGEMSIKNGFLEQQKGSFDMMYSRVLSDKGLGLDVAKISGGPDLTTSSAIVKNVVDYVPAPPSSSIEGIDSVFPSMIKKTKGYQGVFSSMNVSKALSIGQLEELEYGIQSSSYWKGVTSVSSLGLISVLSTGNIQRSRVSSVPSNVSSSKSISLVSSKQAVDVINIQSINLETVSLNELVSLTAPVVVPAIVSPVDSVPFDYTPSIPSIPGFGSSYGLGGGGSGGRRRKKGARSRVHPVTLLNALYVPKRVAI